MYCIQWLTLHRLELSCLGREMGPTTSRESGEESSRQCTHRPFQPMVPPHFGLMHPPARLHIHIRIPPPIPSELHLPNRGSQQENLDQKPAARGAQKDMEERGPMESANEETRDPYGE